MILGRKNDNAGLTASRRSGQLVLSVKWVALAIAGAFALLMVMFVIGITAYRQGYISEAKELSERLITVDYWRLKLDQIVGRPNGLPTLAIDMKFKHVEKIRAKREEAIQNGGLLISSDADYVPADISLDGRTIPVEARLKGNGGPHLEDGKWSLRVKVEDDDHVFGMRRFSIHHPQVQNLVAEWAINENMRMEGVMAPRIRFVNVSFNGDNRGVADLEEAYGPEMMEAHGRRQGVLFTFSEDIFMERQKNLNANIDQHLFNPLDYQNIMVQTFTPNRVDRSPVLARNRTEAIGLLRGFQQGILPASDVFDTDLLARYLAIMELWSASHGLTPLNSVFYYNPITAKLEPVGMDSQVFTSISFPDWVGGRLASLGREWTSEALQDPEVASAFIRELERVTSDEYLVNLRAALGEEYKDYSTLIEREGYQYTPPWAKLKARQKRIRTLLGAPKVLQAMELPMDEEIHAAQPSRRIQIANMFSLPTEVLGLRIGDGSFFPAATALLTTDPSLASVSDEGSVILFASQSNGLPEGRQPLQHIDFTIPMEPVSTVSEAGDITPVYVVNRILGQAQIRETMAVPYPSIVKDTAVPDAPTVSEALERHPYLQVSTDVSMLRIQKGTWNVPEDLVLPRGIGLEVGPGTTLRFASDSILMASGPLVFLGTAQEPVVLEPMNGSWPGIVVMSAKQTSVWHYVDVRNTSGIERGGWTLTGGITFYKSPVALHKSKIIGSLVEGAINIIDTAFEFNEVEISESASDAFDGDFTEGYIIKSVFRDVGGNAMDFRGSTVNIEDTFVRNIGDRGISAGESSKLYVTRFEADNVRLGVASEDNSDVTISNSSIHGFIVTGLAAYTRKQEYGPARITSINVSLPRRNDSTLIQEGSWIENNGRLLEDSELDIKALFNAGLLDN